MYCITSSCIFSRPKAWAPFGLKSVNYSKCLSQIICWRYCILCKATRTPDDINKLQEDLGALQDWLIECFALRRRQDCMFHHIEYRVMFIFRRKLQVFSLGVTIQCDLKWHKHLQFITFETTETDTRFEQHQTHWERVLTLHFLVLEYATTVWNPHLVNDKIMLEKVQRQAARYVKGDILTML